MSQQLINIGSNAGAGDGDDLRVAFDKVNQNFTEIYGGGIVAANVAVESVAGRLGNVVLTVQDIAGAATVADIVALQTALDTATTNLQNYTDNAITNLGAIPAIEVTGGTISGVTITDSEGTFGNLAVTYDATVGGQLSVDGSIGVTQNIAVDGAIIFGDSTQQTTAFPGFEGVFANAASQQRQIAAIAANLTYVGTLANAVVGNLSIDDTTIYVANSGAEITLQPDGTGNVYIGIPGQHNNLVLSQNLVFGDGTTQSTAFDPNNLTDLTASGTIEAHTLTATSTVVTPSVNATYLYGRIQTASQPNITEVGTLVDLAVAGNVDTGNVNLTGQITFADGTMLHSASTVDLGPVNANVAAANAQIAAHGVTLAQLNSRIVATNANVSAANAAILSNTLEIANVQDGLDAANVIIAGLAAADIVSTDANVAAANAAILVNTNRVAAANAAILVNTNRVAAANVEIGKLRANLTAANAEIDALSTTVGTFSGAIGTLQTNVTNLWANAATQEVAINSIRANIGAQIGNAATQSNEMAALRANITAANGAIVVASAVAAADTTAANIEINKLRSNITAANAVIATLTSNAGTQGSEINSLRANIAAANAAIASITGVDGTLGSGLTAANLEISKLQANIAAANAAIVVERATSAANNAVQAAAINAVNANVTAANAQIALRAPVASPTFTGTVTAPTLAVTGSETIAGDLDVTGNITGGNIEVTQVNATQVVGLTSLVVDGLATVDSLYASYITGPVHGNQTGITGLGTLGHLVVDDVTGNGNIIAGNITTGGLTASSFTTPYLNAVELNGYIVEPFQPNITTVGELYNLTVAGMIETENLTVNNMLTARMGGVIAQSVETDEATAGNLIVTRNADIGGKLTVGQYVSSGNISADYGTFTSNLSAANLIGSHIYGPLATAAQPGITSLGTLTGLGVSGNVDVTGNANVTGNVIGTYFLGNVQGLAVDTGNIRATGNISGAYLTGTLVTAAQPNITTVGNLTDLSVAGDTTLHGNLFITSLAGNLGSYSGSFTYVSGTMQTNAQPFITSVGNLATLSVQTWANVTGNLYAGNVEATKGTFTNIEGTVITAAQPNITSLGVLTGLNVVGPVNITGAELISQDLFVTGNLFVQGNTTSVDATSITTQDKTIILANGAPLAAAANGAGLYIGEGGKYGNLSIYNDTWTTANNFTIGGAVNVAGTVDMAQRLSVVGNISGGNVAGTQGDFVRIRGQILDASQTNITTVGNLTSANVDGTLHVAGVTTVSTIQFADGTVQTTSPGATLTADLTDIRANITAANAEIDHLRSNITAANSNISSNYTEIGNLRGNITAANVEIGNLQANIAAANIAISSNYTEIGNLRGNITAANVEIDHLRANITAANSSISSELANTNANVAAANAQIALRATIANPTFTGTVHTPTLLALGNVEARSVAGGNISLWDYGTGVATISTDSANLQINTNGVDGNIVLLDNLQVHGTATTWGNITAANVVTGEVIGSNARFTNLTGTITTGYQPNITDVGYLNSLRVLGTLRTYALEIDTTLSLGTQLSLIDLTVSNGAVIANTSLAFNTTANGALSVLGNTTVGNLLSNGSIVAVDTIRGDNIIANTNVQVLGSAISNSTTSGALTVAGGVGIGGNLYAGGISVFGQPLTFPSTGASIQYGGDTDSYIQILMQNRNSGPLATSDFVATADNGTDSTSYIDLGITNSGFSQAGYSLFSPNDGYLYISGNTTNLAGNLNIGTLNNNDIVFAMGGMDIANEIARFNHTDQNFVIKSTTPSGSYNTGALVVAGGTGIGGKLTVGGETYLTGNATVNNMRILGITEMFNEINMDYPSIQGSSGEVALFTVNQHTIYFGKESQDMQLGQQNGLGNVTVLNDLVTSGNINGNSSIIAKSSYDGTAPYTGGLQVYGGASVNANLFVGGDNSKLGNVTIGGSEINGNILTGNLVSGNIVVGTLRVSSAFAIPSLDGTPVGPTAPSTGNFTTVTAENFAQTYQRPTQRPTIMFDFANGKKLDQRINFVRNSDATYVDRTGNLVVASANQPRFTHDYSTGEPAPMGLLIEQSSTNEILYSNDLTNATGWTAYGVTPQISGNTVSPTGSLDAFEFIEDDTTGLHCLYGTDPTNQPTITNGAYYTASAFVKAGTRTQFQIIFAQTGSAPTFDLTAGTVSVEGSNYYSQIRNFGNGWYRIMTTVSAATTTGNLILAVSSGGTAYYTGQLGSCAGFAYGLQLETGPYPTSYIPTTTTTATRAADDVTLNSSTLSSWFSGTEGTVFVDSMVRYLPTVGITLQRPTLFSFDNGTETDRIQVVAETVNSPTPARFANIVAYTSGVLQANIGTTPSNFNSTGNGRVAMYFKDGFYGVSLNGLTANVQLSGNIPSITTWTLGSGPGAGYLNGTISKIMYYPKKSTNNELRGLTVQ